VTGFALLISAIVAASVLAAAYGIRLGRRATTQAVADVSAYGYGSTAPITTLRQAKRGQENLRLERVMARLAQRLSPADYEKTLQLRLLQAGLYTMRPSRFGMMYANHAPNVGLKLMMGIGGPVLGFLAPDSLLSGRIRRRLDRTERECADMIDLLAITVRSGLGLDQALKVTAERLDGPLAEQVRLMLNEIRIGQSRSEAMRRLAERAPTPTVRSFTRSMSQSESMGVSIGETLKALAVDARTRKRLTAEELAQKAPIKMIFPLAACFFPGILIITAGPGVLALLKVLGS
jgi:tight adherence protein C